MATAQEDIIQLEDGYRQIYSEGIEPFLRFIEQQEREFFKAKDFVKLYDLIFKMCIQRDPYNWSESMYERYTHAILNYLLQKVTPALQRVQSQYDTAFLKEWTLRWNHHKLIVKGLSKLFMYLDRFYTPNTDGILSLKEQGFKLYKENIFDPFAKFARTAILNCIEKERNSEEQDRHLLQEAVAVFVEMGTNYGNKKLTVYKTDLEKDIIDHAGMFYKRKSRTWMDQDSCPAYLDKAEKLLQEEDNRVNSYLHSSTKEPLWRECYTQLLKVHQLELLEKKTGLFHLLSTRSEEDLSRLNRLYEKSAEDLQPIADMLHEHIKKAGTDIVDKARPPAGGAPAPADANHALVRSLIDLHANYAQIVTVCFKKQQVFQKALKKAFEDFINKDNRVSKLLAKFVHDVLRKGSKVNVKDLESTLDNIVFLYGYIQEKDVFERDYQIFLSKRLLEGLCESEHSEKSMIAKLKTECGYQWTNKLEGMFKDVQLSKDLCAKFKGVFDTEKALDIVLDVNVCTTGYWPTSKMIPCNLPKALEAGCTKFKRFYLNQHSGHKLDWRMDQGQAEVQVLFSPKVRRTLIVTTYQMMAMLTFNVGPTMSYKQILDITGIPKPELAHHLLSLAHPSVKVLEKKPNNKDLADDHKFRVNPAFTSKLMKVVVPLMKQEVDGKDNDEGDQVIELQRRHQIDAATVRIMKARKTMRHNLLVAEVIQQLSARFKPTPPMIKKRIEALIEQDYLARDPKDRALYNYLA